MPNKPNDKVESARDTLKRALTALQEAAKEATDRDRVSLSIAITQVSTAIAVLPDVATAKIHCANALKSAVVRDTYAADKAIVGLSVQQARFEITNAVTFNL